MKTVAFQNLDIKYQKQRLYRLFTFSMLTFTTLLKRKRSLDKRQDEIALKTELGA